VGRGGLTCCAALTLVFATCGKRALSSSMATTPTSGPPSSTCPSTMTRGKVTPSLAGSNDHVGLRLTHEERLDGDYLWLKYEVVR